MSGRFAETVAGSTSRSSQETNAQQKGHAMRSITLVTLTTLAIASILGTAGTSHAATWGGFAFAPGTPRIVTLINQASAGASNATSYLRVVRCTGVIDYPVFTWLGATCTAVTPDYTISMTVLSATKTNVKIVANSAACGIKEITFGTPNSQCGYDLTNPNPGTIGSLAGSNPVPVAGGLVGAWNVTVLLDNMVNLAGVGAMRDLFSRMTVRFNSCFDVGDLCSFTIDTDKIS
jgi:hypothetical protein